MGTWATSRTLPKLRLTLASARTGPTTTRGFVLKHVQWEQSELLLKLDPEQAFDQNSLKIFAALQNTVFTHMSCTFIRCTHFPVLTRILSVFLKYKTTQSS